MAEGITWDIIKNSIPAVAVVAGAVFFVYSGIKDSQANTAALSRSIEKLEQVLEPVPNMHYRLTRAEDSIKEINIRVDNLSNTMINNIDLIRRDVNRLTTQVEVLSSQIGMVLGEEKIPVQRRSRPPGPIPSGQ